MHSSEDNFDAQSAVDSKFVGYGLCERTSEDVESLELNDVENSGGRFDFGSHDKLAGRMEQRASK